MMMHPMIIFGFQQFQFASLKYLWLVFLLPVLFLVYLYGFYRKEKALQKFAAMSALKFIAASASRQRQLAKAIILLLAVLLLVLALMRPRGNPTEEQVTREGRDVCFLLDVSNSMRAEDLKPNRLTRAKLAIKDVIEIMEGDRVGLIIFAGSVAIKSPLTTDYHFFGTIVDKTSPRDVSQGGTNIGDSIRQAVDRVLIREETEYKDIILITDGEDLEDSFPIEAAQYAAQNGIRIHTVGLGNPDGTPIPDQEHPGRYLQYDGKTVMSRLDEKTLRTIAAATPNGTYIGVGTGTFNLDDLYRKTIATAEKQEYQTQTKIKWTEWFQVPLLIAIILLVLEWFISDRRGRHLAKPLSLMLLAVISIGSIGTAFGGEITSERVREGNELFEEEKYDESLVKYKEAEEFLPESPLIQFNMAAAHYQKEDYKEAANLYNDVVTSSKSSPEMQRKAIYNLGNCSFKEGERLLDADLEKSLGKFTNSIGYYRDAIEKGEGPRKDWAPPEIEDAKHNIEVARLRIKDILDKLKQQQEQQQEQQEKQQDFEQKFKDAIEKQKELKEKSAQMQEEKKQNPDADMSPQTAQARQEQDENKKLTEELSQEIDRMKQEMAEKSASDPMAGEKLDKAKQHLDESAIDQGSASENLGREELQKARNNQTKALENLEKALEALSEKQEQDQSQRQPEKGDDSKGEEKQEERSGKSENKQDSRQKQPKKEGEITPEDAKKEIEEMKARFRKARKQREKELKDQGIRVLEGTGRTPVDKDW